MDRLNSLLEAGIDPERVSQGDLRRIREVTAVSLLTVLIGIPFILVYARLGVNAMSVAVAATCVMGLGNVMMLRRTLRPRLHGAFGTTILLMLLVASNIASGGFYDPNFGWLYMIPMLGTFLVSTSAGFVFTAIVMAVTVAFWMAPQLGYELVSQIPAEGHAVQSLANRLSALSAIGVVLVAISSQDRSRRDSMARSNDDLQRANDALTAEMEARAGLHEQLVHAERMASMGTLAAGLAHEINNPLTYVTGNLQLLEEDLRDHASAEVMQRIHDIADGAERVRKLVTDLKTFSHADDSELEAIDVKPALERALNIAANHIKHRARLIRDYEDVPHVLGNEQRLVQVFLNLVTNAAQAIKPGDVRGNEVRVTLRHDDDVVRFEIRDTGTGVPLDVQARMFEPYFTTKKPDEGTGLGLSICRNIVSAMGGELQLIQEERKGATFRMLLPVTHERTLEEITDGQNAAVVPAIRAPRILVVDDEPHIRRLITSALRGCRVIAVETGHDALVANDNTDFDMQIYDIMMPTMSGIELYQEIQRRYPGRAKNIYLMTGGVSTASKHPELKQLDVKVLPKPLDIGALRKLVNEHCDVKLLPLRRGRPSIH